VNTWLFAIIISLILFLLLVDWKQLAINIYGGGISGIYQLIESNVAYNTGLWKRNYAYSLVNSIHHLEFINVFSAGIAFTMGVIFFQLLPKRLGLQFIHAFVWTLFYALFNFLNKENNMLNYFHFRFFMVTHVFIFFLSLAWFKTFWLTRKNALIMGDKL
jgi:hypothetical protein